MMWHHLQLRCYSQSVRLSYLYFYFWSCLEINAINEASVLMYYWTHYYYCVEKQLHHFCVSNRQLITFGYDIHIS